MHSLIIHMSSATARRPNVDHLLGVLPGAEVVEAVRGADVVQAGRVDVRPGDLHHPRYPFPIGGGEVGCFLSHRACWARIVEADWPYALIVEDDFHPDAQLWPDVLGLVETNATADSYIRLPAKNRERPAHVAATKGAAQLFLPRRIGLQTVAQVVGRNAAQRLLEASEVLDRPVDTFLQMHWVTGQPVHTILPNGVQELTGELGGSTIQKKAPKQGRLLREWNRAWYRTQVALRPQRP
ncbi:MAG: glycosyltransferase family 25 protein [Paracoccaceae bacterium]